ATAAPRRDADDGEGMAVQIDTLAYHRRVEGEAALPVAITDNGDGVLARGVILFKRERSTRDRFHTQGRKVAPRDKLPTTGGNLRLSIGGHTQGCPSHGEHAREHLVMVAQGFEERIGKAEGAAS